MDIVGNYNFVTLYKTVNQIYLNASGHILNLIQLNLASFFFEMVIQIVKINTSDKVCTSRAINTESRVRYCGADNILLPIYLSKHLPHENGLMDILIGAFK